MAAVSAQGEQEEPQVPVSFRVSTYWKLPRGTAGVTQVDSKRVSLPQALLLLFQQLSEQEMTLTDEGQVTTIVIDWSKVPEEIRDPFKFGVRR